MDILALDNSDLKKELDFLINLRDKELEKFNDLIKADETQARINAVFDSLMKKQAQIKTIEDAMIILVYKKYVTQR